MKNNPALVIVILALICACSFFKNSSVPKEQIDKDIADKAVDIQEGSAGKWVFEADKTRCFKVVDAESETTSTTADVVVTIGSWQELTLGDKTTYLTVFGKMLMKYKKENDKWVLEKIEPKDLISKNLEMDQFKKWLDIQIPLCTYSRFTSY